MYVCKKCHEQDAYSTGCNRDFGMHDVMTMGHCDICGFWATTVLCAMYEISVYKEKEAIKKLIK